MTSICKDCDRPQPSTRPTDLASFITHCGGCGVPFALDEIRKLFSEANMLDTNAARQFRRQLVDDLISALWRAS